MSDVPIATALKGPSYQIKPFRMRESMPASRCTNRQSHVSRSKILFKGLMARDTTAHLIFPVVYR